MKGLHDAGWPQPISSHTPHTPVRQLSAEEQERHFGEELTCQMYEVTFKDEQGQPMELLGVSVLQLQDLVERCEEVWGSVGKCGKVPRCWPRAGNGPGAVQIEMQCAGVAVALCSLDSLFVMVAVPWHPSLPVACACNFHDRSSPPHLLVCHLIIFFCTGITRH